jgi:hypothetical protein
MASSGHEWDEDLNRQTIQSIKSIVKAHREGDADNYYHPQDAIDAIGELFDELEGPDWEHEA